MESLVSSFWHNWQRKLFALVAALIVWFFVGHSITETKTIRNVPIRISNLPSDKTIIGLLPNGILNKRINLILSGSKDVIEEVEPGDLEVNIDASSIDHNDWIVQINKKNLVSLNPNIDIVSNINSVSHTEFVIKLNRLVTANIPVQVLVSKGESPPGYAFLDVWPQKLMQVVSGPEEQIQKLQAKGLQLVLDLNEISKGDLDSIKSPYQPVENNEISFPVPSKWKKVRIPIRNHNLEALNDPDAQYLRIDFLRQELLPVETKLPIRIFFPTLNLKAMNPDSVSIAEKEGVVAFDNGVSLFQPQLYVKNVSRLFLDVVRNYLSLNIVAAPKTETDILLWNLEIVSSRELEETYVAYQVASSPYNKQLNSRTARKKENLYRARFRSYLQKLALYLSLDHKLNIESSINDNKIEITDY